MVDEEIVLKKLRELEKYLLELERLRRMPLQEMRGSLQKAWSVEHGLQLAIQCVIDVGNHILAAIGENRINEYADIIDRLGERKILPVRFAKRIRDMAGFRNILVHEYVGIDLKRVYHILQNRLGDFEKFIRYIRDFLQ